MATRMFRAATMLAAAATAACQSTAKTATPASTKRDVSFARVEGTAFEPLLQEATLTTGAAGKLIRVVVYDRATLARNAQQLRFYVVGDAKEGTRYDVAQDCVKPGVVGACVDFVVGAEIERGGGQVTVTQLPAAAGDPFALEFSVSVPSGKAFEGTATGTVAAEDAASP